MVLIDIARINKERNKTNITALFVVDFTDEDGASILHDGRITPRAIYKAMKVREVISVLYPKERR